MNFDSFAWSKQIYYGDHVTRHKLLVTGGSGMFAAYLAPRLRHQMDLNLVDMPGVDLRDPAALDSLLPGYDAVLHLAWDTKGENMLRGVQPDNRVMVNNVLDKALEHGVRRVVLASSVHADWRRPTGDDLLSTDAVHPSPSSQYGRSKLVVEAMGRDAAARGLEVVAIRFGGMNGRDLPPKNNKTERLVWLSQADGADLVRRSLTQSFAQLSPTGSSYACVYGVSANEGGYHDLSNPFGWVPRLGAAKVPHVESKSTFPKPALMVDAATIAGPASRRGSSEVRTARPRP